MEENKDELQTEKNTASIGDFCQCQPLASLLHSLDNRSAKYQISAREILLLWWLEVAKLKKTRVWCRYIDLAQYFLWVQSLLQIDAARWKAAQNLGELQRNLKKLGAQILSFGMELGWKLVSFLTGMTWNLDDRSSGYSICLYTHCPGFVVSLL